LKWLLQRLIERIDWTFFPPQKQTLPIKQMADYIFEIYYRAYGINTQLTIVTNFNVNLDVETQPYPRSLPKCGTFAALRPHLGREEAELCYAILP
jgi:hypothetical protein